jgi:uncharacterized cupin superfamily protein
MPVIEDPLALQGRRGTVYPAEHASGFEGRVKRAMTEKLGLTQFGVNITTLEPGARSSLRHSHAQEDEFVYVLSGELTLITNDGERKLRASMAAGFPRGDGDGHHLVNNGTAPASYLEIGTRSSDDDVDYPDLDMKGVKRGGRYSFFRKNGDPYD